MPAAQGAIPLPLLALLSVFAALVGLGGYTFVYAKGGSYLTNDPLACANCHVMQAQFDGWRRGPHHAVAVCNDCHVPGGLVSKYVVKALNGWHHSSAFTTGKFPDVITMRPESREIVEGQCKACHADLVAAMGGPDVSCVRCHESVGHLR